MSNELAPFGDKYAQYMAGYMCQWGQGVEEGSGYGIGLVQDCGRARRHRSSSRSGTRLLDSLDPDRDRSDIEYIELRKKYSDLVVVMKLLRKEYDELQDAGDWLATGRAQAGR